MSAITLLSSCQGEVENIKEVDNFNYVVESFEDIQMLRYKVEGFEDLTLKQKELIYYLSEAAICGRDILFDQNGNFNLTIRRSLEAIYLHYKGDRETREFKALERYLKRVWFANGIHHHYSTDKFQPEFPDEFFVKALQDIDISLLPIREGKSFREYIESTVPIMFEPEVLAKKVNQADGEDLVATSAVNFYKHVTQEEVENYYNDLKDPNNTRPISYGLNSRVEKVDGKVIEKVWKVGGLYSEALTEIVGWLEKARDVAENDAQRAYIDKLISFNKSCDLAEFDEYAILWAEETASQVDFVLGFTETYSDPLGMKGSWEGVINFKNLEASARTEIISSNAQWFEDHSPVDKRFKKEEVKGVSAKVITAAMLGGDSYPASPLGINLPNSNWIRSEHGSKSVSLENIAKAYDMASQGNGFAEEFVWSDTERNLLRDYGFQANNLHTDLHECLGHGSGKLLEGVDSDALKAYGAPLEEARADLFALYYIADPKMVKLGLLPNKEAYKASYYNYLMNGYLTQLIRISLGKNIEQAHMRNRQTIAAWVLEKAAKDRCVEIGVRDGKRYIVINDYKKVRNLFGELLAEIQRIKSEGDYEAGKNLIETYGVKVDKNVHLEIINRNRALRLPPYKGFVNPRMTAVKDENGNIIDVTLDYTEGYAEQHLRYSKDYSFLPSVN